ncbi:hypothetical protein N8I71_08650 [Roseibacterium sp. SDUM158016]|uniref:hypothetical protein n=1 Tax=Roseicyclus sediminis TaxID=2980997 RepID=UPI0021D0295D|nr:hypothetical protein [Roseibacterium sp. SDUM158016]MCU4652899.1 hypothetical protein [Roseibacterium sp. SDUM158016]
MTSRFLPGALALTIAATFPAAAQTDRPPGETEAFAAAMAETLGGTGNAASLLRCTAVFRAFHLYAGTDTQVGATAAERETDMAVSGVVVWQDETGTDDLDAAFETVVPMVTAATELYLDRMVANAEAGDSVFDPDLEAELSYCSALHERIMDRDAE